MSDQHATLQTNSLGWFGQFSQSIAHMAPAYAVICGVPFMASRAGSALPLASVLALLLCLMLAYCLSLLTRKYFGASGYFQIHSRALGSKLGFTTSWLFFLYEPLNAVVVFIGFGTLVLEPFSTAYLGVTIPWWVSLIAGNLLVTFFALKKMKNSIRITAVLGLMEFFIMLALGVLLLVKSDHHFHPEYFTPSMSADGTGGLMFAFIFSFLAFAGFESGLPLTEETKETKGSTSKGLIWSVILTGIFYIFISYATVIGFGGGEDTVQFAKTFSSAADPYSGILASKAFGTIGHWLMFFAALNSTIACALAGHNSATRVFFSLGRAQILPKMLGHVTQKGKVPVNAVLFASLVTFTVGFAFYIFMRHGNLMAWYGLLALLLALPLLIIHFVTCISVFVVYRYKEPQEFNLLRHGIIPLTTSLLVLLPLWGAVYYNQATPMSYAPYVTGIWFIIGVVVYVWLKKHKPQTLETLEHEMERLTHKV